MPPNDAFPNLPEAKRRELLRAGVAEFSRRMYADGSTDAITAAAGISKGLLFHYFGTKKAFYLYCLEQALERLTQPTPESRGDSFHDILFAAMDEKIALCRAFPEETRLVNLASRDGAREIATEKAELLRRYLDDARARSAETLRRALACVRVRPECAALACGGLTLYATALVNRYLTTYQERPEAFFAQIDDVRREFRQYIDLMLHGIEQEENE